MTSTTARNLGICGLFLVSGVLALIYEVLWQRRFGLLFGSAAPATAAVLAAYFAGLALGSLTIGRMSRRWKRPLKVYAVLELLIATGAVLTPILLDSFAPIYRSLSQNWAATPALLLASKVVMGFVAIGLPTFCMGGTLPILAELVDNGERRAGWNAGLLYLANTLGAATGALVVPFVLLRFMGIVEAADLGIAETRINREDRPWVEVLGPLLHAGEASSKLCTGRQLQTWIRGIRERSAARASTLGSSASLAGEAGDIMYEFAIALSEGNQGGARQAQSRLRERLPEAVYRSLFGVQE